MTLLLVQALNGAQLGMLLFLISAGLTLVFGVMNFVNLAHGVQYMLGAYLGVMFSRLAGGFWPAFFPPGSCTRSKSARAFLSRSARRPTSRK